MPPRRLPSWTVDVVLVAGVICLVASAFLAAVARNLVDPRAFAARTAEGLDDPRVSRFVADRLVQGIIAASPDLVTVRPVLLVTAEGIVSSKPFAAIVRRTALETHRRLFSEGGRGLMLSAPDLGILLRQALEQASPQLAEKIPDGVVTVMGDVGKRGAAEFVVRVWRLGHRARLMARIGALVGFMLVGLAIGLARNRMRAVARGGILLIAGSVLLASMLPLGRLAIASMVEDPLTRGALQGLWRTYLGELLSWGLFLGGLGILFTAAATSLLESLRPHDYFRAGLRVVVTPPTRRLSRVAWGFGLLALGIAAIMISQEILTVSMVLAGILVALFGVRELFRLILESVDTAETSRGSHGGLWLKTGVVFATVVALATVWLLLRRPDASAVAVRTDACNGYPELCGRRLDEVAFAAAHNAMSNASISDWMFPHHQTGIHAMLEDGIRALMLDVHYGFPGGERIKTDMEGERMTRDKLVEALGEEGVAAAERIRERLVGVDEGKRGLYLCHGFCELGAIPFVPVLRDVRDFLVQHPEEVMILVFEDYVPPADIAGAFTESGLYDLVYEGPSGPPWPTLAELVETNRRVIVFLESGDPAIPWLRPVIGNIQETPYTFHTPEDFSCRPNRGGTEGSLFLINHWLETTPTPKPSNAEIVNARDVLLRRVLACAKARKHIPNLVSVDFYGSGDLIEVVDELNGFGLAASAPDRAKTP